MLASFRNSYWEQFAQRFRELDAQQRRSGAKPSRLEILIAGEWWPISRFDLTMHEDSRDFMHFGTGSEDIVVRSRDIQALRWVYDD